MPMYRKKPVEVMARQLGQSYDEDIEIVKWCGGEPVGEDDGHYAIVAIQTLEGRMVGSVNDWIIQGVEGEFYPCKPSIFAATYEDADVETVTIRADERERILRQRDHLLATVQRLASMETFTVPLDLKASSRDAIAAELMARGGYATDRLQEAIASEMSRPTDWPS